MKLLLTSAGITNPSIAKTFLDMVGKAPSEIKVAFIPTAANVEPGNKVDWFLHQYEDLLKLGITWIDIVDFAAPDVDWRVRLGECDALLLSGGNTFYLLDQMRKQGFDSYLKQVLHQKVYVGISASTITMGPTIDVATIPPSDPNIPSLTDLTGLGYVDFEVEPHCTVERFEIVEGYASQRSKKVYAIDDQTAVAVVDGVVTITSEGDWRLYDVNHSA